MKTVLFFISLVIFEFPVFAGNFFVSSSAGADTNPGTPVAPWQTFEKVNSAMNAGLLSAGDSVFFKAGDSWVNQLLYIPANVQGTASQNIVFTRYGSGNNPLFKRNVTGDMQSTIEIHGSYLAFRKLFIDTTFEAGCRIYGSNNRIDSCYFSSNGLGIEIEGAFNTINGCHFRKFHMVINTPGGEDDYGAVGIVLRGNNNIIRFNTFDSLFATSYDFGRDGGAVEFYGDVSNCTVEKNSINNTEGFVEAGGPAGSSILNNLVAYNVYQNSLGSLLFCFHTNGSFGAVFNNFRVYNNTFICSSPSATWEPLTGCYDAVLPGGSFLFRNNIFYVTNYNQLFATNSSGITHGYNIFFRSDAAVNLGIAKNSTELTADPLFVNLISGNFYLTPASPAIDHGISTALSQDITNFAVPFGPATDIGAYEYHGNWVLPVRWEAFYATSRNRQNLLYWNTSDEFQNYGFRVERSADGFLFDSIGFVLADENTGTAHHYSYLDPNPQQVSYYRLQQLDFSGQGRYSKIISIKNKGDEAEFSLFPNPATSEIIITSSSKNSSSALYLFDNSGKHVKTVLLKAGKAVVPVADLPQGLYWCRSGTFTVSFTKH